MDLYFITIGIMITGIIFATLIYIVSNSINLAYDVKNMLVKPADSYEFDTLTTIPQFIIDVNSFVVFVLGQQHLHSIILMNGKEYYKDKINRVRVEFNVERTLNTGDKVIEKIKVTSLTEDKEVESTWNAVDVSGQTGLMIDAVKDFKDYVLSKDIKTIKVTQYNTDNGNIYLVCEPNN